MDTFPPNLPGQDWQSQDFNSLRRVARSLQPMVAPGAMVTRSPAFGSMVRPVQQRQVASGSKGTSDFQGVYVNGETYNSFDEVLIQAGPGAGEYISTADNNNNDPRTGINWIQLSSLTQWF